MKTSKPNIKSKIKTFLSYIWSFGPLFLSHHPECDEFKEHTINISKVRLCIGCFVGYPTAIFGIYIIDLLNLNNIIYPQYLLMLSVLCLSTIVLSPLKKIKRKKYKILQKFIIGFGASFLFWGIRNLPNPMYINRIIFYHVFSILLSLLNLYHAYGFISTCYKCKDPFNWGQCLGFSSIQKRFQKHGLDNFLIPLNGLTNKIKNKRIQKIEN